MASRGTWVFRNGKLIPKSEASRLDYGRVAHAMSHLAAPAIRSDKIEKPFVSHIDGRTVFDSKSAWERHVRENGCIIVGDSASAVPLRHSGFPEHLESITDSGPCRLVRCHCTNLHQTISIQN